jgi:geranylgeranyl diphosphate/geranylgeranyl-bacteriochlorophyllide a reductase
MTTPAVTACETFDVVVVGGGPAGATAAGDLARMGRKVMLLDRQGRIKPCGGAIPPRLIKDFDIPDHLLCARIRSARMIAPRASPSTCRWRTASSAWSTATCSMNSCAPAPPSRARSRAGNFLNWSRDQDGVSLLEYREKDSQNVVRVRAHMIIGADGANSAVARQAAPKAGRAPFVFAYHEIIRTPEKIADRAPPRDAKSTTRARSRLISMAGCSRTAKQ